MENLPLACWMPPTGPSLGGLGVDANPKHWDAGLPTIPCMERVADP